jgi:hypothetical protein
MSEDTHGLQCKGRLINLDTEDALRDVLGLSHAAAKSIAQRGFKVANEQPSRLDSFVASLRDVRRQI